MGFGLIGKEDVISLWDNVRTKTNRVGLSGIETIAGLGLSGTKAKLFWYDVSTKRKRWWHGCSGRESPLAMEEYAGQWAQQKYGTTLWGYGDLAEN